MAQFDAKTKEIIRRLQCARLSLMNHQPFYAVLLMGLKFALDLTCETAYTDGERIAFNPDFIEDLSDSELEFVLMHEVLHTVLCHPFRRQAEYEAEAFDQACDVIVNSNILYSLGGDESKITLKKYGVGIHQMPDGSEGYLHTLEEAYRAFLVPIVVPQEEEKEDQDGDQEEGLAIEIFDDAGKEDSKASAPKNRKKEKNKGSSKKPSAKLKEAMDELDALDAALGEMIRSIQQSNAQKNEKYDLQKIEEEEKKKKETPFRDDHSFWRGDTAMGENRAKWIDRLINATEIIDKLESSRDCGAVPMGARVMLRELMKPTLNWRTILQDFLQEEICDYSFSPPDRRMDDCPFFLPDFNEKDEVPKKILFMIDTSGSMSTEAITRCYSEIYGGIQQFNGKLEGWLGFFDAVVVKPIPFTDEEEFKVIRPVGGGGTSFEIIFDYVREEMRDDLPASIVILTDGYAPIPEEEQAMGIPVLWIINNEEVTPEWGKIARIAEDP